MNDLRVIRRFATKASALQSAFENIVQPVPEIVNQTPFLTSYPLLPPVNDILADYGNVMLLMSVANKVWTRHDKKPCDDNKEVVVQF